MTLMYPLLRTPSMIIYLEYDAHRREKFFVQQRLIERESRPLTCVQIGANIIHTKEKSDMIGTDSLNWVSGIFLLPYEQTAVSFMGTMGYSSPNQGHGTATLICQAFINQLASIWVNR